MRIARFTAGDDPLFGVVHEDEIYVITGDPLYTPLKPTGAKHKLEDVRLLAPVIPRSKVVGVGRNYAAHAGELGHDVPERPLLFFKPNTAVIGPDDPIPLPAWSNDIQLEGELAVIIGRFCKDVPVERVDEAIFGYTVANDVTARDVQHDEIQWARAKGFDGSCPIGPWIETEIDPGSLRITSRIDGETVQDSSTSLMLHPVRELIAEISTYFTLLPGDIVLTGTPEGVRRIEDRQLVEIEIEGIGTLTNTALARD